MTSILHCSDIHVKNLKYHDEQREVFERFYEEAIALAPDYIIISGDLFHAKSRISAEAYVLGGEFLRRTADIAETHLILGNHDTVLNNKNRLDSITPVADALNHPNLHYHKYSDEHDLNDEIVINVLSLLDRKQWVLCPTQPEKINIALFHGAIVGTETETGWVIEHGDAFLEQFDEFDYAMLGDIHGTNIRLDPAGRKRYPGSLVQNNFGEQNNKGFLYWEIESKTKYTCRHIHIPNPKPFTSLTLTKKGNLPRSAKVPEGSRLRIVCETAIPFEKLNRAGQIAKHKWDLESVVFLNKAPRYNQDGTLFETLDLDLRSIDVQEKLIKDYLADFDVSDATMEEVYRLNTKYNNATADLDDVKRYVRWAVEEFEWDSLFNYGEGNRLDFRKLGGVVGVFGGNYTGKTASVEALLYTMFNSTAKNEKKSVNVINQNKDAARGMVTLKIGDERYVIQRDLEKYTKVAKGKTSEEAKTALAYYRIVDDKLEPLNGETRIETDKMIRSQFGTIDDFLLTAFTSQHGALAYINEGSTKRKEILAKFIDLQMFERKFKMAKEHSDEIRGALRKLEAEGIDYDDLIEEAEEERRGSERKIRQTESACKSMEDAYAGALADLAETELALASIPENIDEIMKARNELPKAEAKVRTCEINLQRTIQDRIEAKAQKEKFDTFFKVYEAERCSERHEELSDLLTKQGHLGSSIDDLEEEVVEAKRQLDLLGNVPCKGEYDCQFISEAKASERDLPALRDSLSVQNLDLEKLLLEIENLDPEMVFDCMKKHDVAKQMLEKLTAELHALEVKMHKERTREAEAKAALASIQAKVEEYEKNKEAIQNVEKLKEDNDLYYFQKNNFEGLIKSCKADLLELHRLDGALEQKLVNLNESKDRLENYRISYSAYDLFLRCMHPSGISYEIIKQKLPIINEEIAKILANVVNFEIFFENDDNKLNIYIRHPKYDKRPIELGSGAEKTLAAIAIRLALLDITSLPVPDFFILDEPATDLDENNLEGFTRILDMIKAKFRIVFLISHLESLKDSADMQLSIVKTNGYAKISQ